MKRLDSLELANARRAAVLTGPSFSMKKQERIREICDFLNQELEVFVRIEDAYTLGGGPQSPTVIVFQTMQDKETVFGKKSKLQDTSNNLGKPVFLNHYLPACENEKRKHERKIKTDIKYSKEEKKPEVTFSKGAVYVGAEKYTKKVTAPSPTDLLKYTVQELDKIMEQKTMKGPTITEKGNTFIPYAMDVNDFQAIRDGYLKLRLIHAPARHIVCAYHLPGQDAQKHLNSDSCDDQD